MNTIIKADITFKHASYSKSILRLAWSKTSMCLMSRVSSMNKSTPHELGGPPALMPRWSLLNACASKTRQIECGFKIYTPVTFPVANFVFTLGSYSSNAVYSTIARTCKGERFASEFSSDPMPHDPLRVLRRWSLSVPRQRSGRIATIRLASCHIS